MQLYSVCTFSVGTVPGVHVSTTVCMSADAKVPAAAAGCCCSSCRCTGTDFVAAVGHSPMAVLGMGVVCRDSNSVGPI